MAQAISLRAKRRVDLLATDAGKLALQIADDPVTLCEMAFDLTAAQREPLGIREESEFLERFDGDTWEDFTGAVVEAMIDFFPPARREPLRIIWARRRANLDRAAAEVTRRATNEQTLSMIDQETDRALAEFDRRLKELGTIRS